ncbi:MAG: methionyl-tRNA formyltransferase [Acidobacteria bacterium]|nr:methionyl-tRNA formyltransferase [Acidobacteriota bacterium]
MVKIAFFGTPAFAVPTLERLLASPHPVVAAVTQPDRPRGRGRRVSESPVKQYATAGGVPVLQPERMKDPAFMDALADLAPDLGVVAAYGRMLPDALLALPRLGMINVHASLLPKYRGAAPIHRAVMAGEPETGITIIRLVREMDAGPMLRRAAAPIGPDDTSETLDGTLARLGAAVLMEAVDELDRGCAIEEDQDHALATFAPRLTREDGVIDWTRPARVLHDQVRGLHPWPRAACHLDGARYLLHRTAVAARPPASPAGGTARPGQVIEAADGRLVVAAGADTALAILEIQPEGGRPLPARAFLAGRRVRPGAIFSQP